MDNKKRLFFILISFLSMGAQAHAMERLYASGITCQQIKTTLERESAIIIHYPSRNTPGFNMSDRFVSSANYCESAKRALPIAINTRDTTTCKIPICREQKDDAFN